MERSGSRRGSSRGPSWIKAWIKLDQRADQAVDKVDQGVDKGADQTEIKLDPQIGFEVTLAMAAWLDFMVASMCIVNIILFETFGIIVHMQCVQPATYPGAPHQDHFRAGLVTNTHCVLRVCSRGRRVYFAPCLPLYLDTRLL